MRGQDIVIPHRLPTHVFVARKRRCRFRDVRLHLCAGGRVFRSFFSLVHGVNSPQQSPACWGKFTSKKVTAVEVNPVSYDTVQVHECVDLHACLRVLPATEGDAGGLADGQAVRCILWVPPRIPPMYNRVTTWAGKPFTLSTAVPISAKEMWFP